MRKKSVFLYFFRTLRNAPFLRYSGKEGIKYGMTIGYSPPLVPPQGGKQKFTSSLEGGLRRVMTNMQLPLLTEFYLNRFTPL